jgi:hypothetical protein
VLNTFNKKAEFLLSFLQNHRHAPEEEPRVEVGKTCMHSFSTSNVWGAQGLQQINQSPSKKNIFKVVS